MARDLCYYLQEQGKLRGFYRELVANSSTDPSGYLTLAKCLGSDDMSDVQREWEAYVMKLRF